MIKSLCTRRPLKIQDGQVSWKPLENTSVIGNRIVLMMFFIFQGGKFLDFLLIPKPGSCKDDPEYYGLNDLYHGAMLDIFGHRFCLKTVDPYVLEFINTNPSCFSDHVKQNIKEYFDCREANGDTAESRAPPCDPGREVCEAPIGEGFFEFLGLGSKKRNIHPCADNPNPCPMPYDWDKCRTLGYNCGVQRPELSLDDLECIDRVCDKPCQGNPDMFETKETAVCQPERFLAPGKDLENFIQCNCDFDWPNDNFVNCRTAHA